MRAVQRAPCAGMILVLLSSGCTLQSQEQGIWWHPELGIATTADIEDALEEPIDPPLEVQPATGTADGSSWITDCHSYFKLTGRGFEALSAVEYMEQKAIGARCHALRALAAAEPASTAHVDDFRLDQDAPDRLPPDLAVAVSPDQAEEVAAAKAKEQSWRAYQPELELRVDGPHAAIVEGDGWGTRLELYARGDFDGDGVADVLIRADDWVEEGTFRDVRLLLLTRGDGERRLSLLKEYL